MRQKVLAVLTMAATAIALGCLHPIRNTNYAMQSWVGHHESEVIRSWGPPTQTADDGAGGKILIYDYQQSYTTPGTAVATTQTRPSGSCASIGGVTQPCNLGSTSTTRTVITPPKTQTYGRSRMFYVNAQGYVYSWRWQGL